MTEYAWDHLIQEGRVHRSLYTDEGVFALEMTRVFGHVWTYLGHETEIPNPNDFKLTKLGLRPVILTRDAKGELHALFNRCMHRGVTICAEHAGNAKRFVCPYHGWAYGNTGKLIGVPHSEGYGEAFEMGAFDLKRVPRVASYRGFVFGTLSETMPSIEDHLGGARAALDAFIDRAPVGQLIVRAGAYRGAFNGNWKLVWDNAADGYHVQFAHKSLVDMTNKRYAQGRGADYMASPDNSPIYAEVFERGHTFLHHRPGMGPSLWERARPTPGGEAYAAQLADRRGDAEARAALEGAPGFGMNLNIFPNLLIIANQIQVVEPLAVNRTQLTWYATHLAGAEPEVNVLRMRIAEDFPNFGEVDDMEMFERCQEGLAVPEAEWVDCSRGLYAANGADDAARKVRPTDEATMRNYFRAYKMLMQSGGAYACS
ncbi:MAG: Rieske 2Fe-2S domain-containing protein [Hyphomonadaceae bacterium JAD_PAG50586_4]|nr:MAG: Rieske 2Fe-2S domain-containing protein [Hyphomonadaceae bacterium JAD_PAG50586_4]